MILSQITLVCAAGRIDSLFTTRALEHMGVEPGTEVDVMIKASQIALEARHVD
ncbi:TOBE domain-containing protein [Geobacter sp. FeAm09]|uniref:TOBE domain-containing protein n=1 Tax=Geobacter sp. FeAm09 TaxID=2597769 RepID=UPI001F0FB833|nr:TOBE domain-containing protein [Geobacter sp. FeAm09]